MKKIKFKKVIMQNFMGYTDLFEYDIVDGLTLITGPNGKGKTSIFECICYCLYGVNSKGVGGDDIINTEIGKNCFTQLYFDIIEDENIDEYNISRYRNYKNKGTTAILEGPIKATGLTEVKNKIESIVLPYKLFTNSIFFAQDINDFFTKLPDTQKKEIFRKVLSLDEFTDYLKNCNEKEKIELENINKIDNLIILKQSLIKDKEEYLKKLENDKINFNNNKNDRINNIKSQIKELEIKKHETQYKISRSTFLENRKLDIINSDINVCQNELNNIDEKINSEKSRILSERELKVEKIKNNYKDLTSKGDSELEELISNEKEKVNKELNEFNEKINVLDIKIMQINTEKTYLFKDIESNEKEINKINNSLNLDVSLCPVCHRELNDTVKNELKLEINNYKNIIGEIKRKLINLDNQLNEIEKEKTQLQLTNNNYITNYEGKIDKIRREHKIISQSLVEKCNEEISEVNDKSKIEFSKVLEKFNQIKLDLQNKKIELSKEKNLAEELLKLFDEIKTFDDKIKEYEFQIKLINEQTFDNSLFDKIKNEILEILEELETISEDKKFCMKRLNAIRFWKQGFSTSGIPSMLIDEAIPFMNSRILDYLDLISNGRYIVSFDTLSETKSGEIRDKISIRFLDTVTKNNHNSTMSKGQRRIVDISTILTLTDLQVLMHNVEFNLFIFDEIFDSLDEENTENVARLLNKLAESKSINLISHTHINQINPDRILDLTDGSLTTVNPN